MEKRRPRVPIGLPIAVVVLLILGAIFKPVMSAILSPEMMETQLLLMAAPFILIFVAIVVAFISFIWLLASFLNNNISPRIYRPVEAVIIAGIVLGVVGMFQPWLHILYRIGFHLLLFSTIAFIVWSHIIPKRERRQGLGETFRQG